MKYGIEFYDRKSNRGVAGNMFEAFVVSKEHHYRLGIFFNSGSTIKSIVVIQAVPPMTLEMGSAINTPSDPK